METRIHDLAELRRAWNNAHDPSERKAIEEAGRRIRNETKAVKDMRETLIRQHRQGNKENIKDIHDIVEHNLKYRE